MSENRQQQLAVVALRLQQKWGQQVSQPLSDLPSISTISTGISELDQALHIGGLPYGHLTEVAGIATSGATSLIHRLIAAVQHQGLSVAMVDLAREFDAHYAVQNGVLLDQLSILHPPHINDALEVIHDVLVVGEVDFLIVDANGQQPPAEKLRRTLQPLRQSDVVLVWLMLGSISPALADQAAVRIDCQHGGWLYDDDEMLVGFRSTITINKNRFAPGNSLRTLDIRLADL